MSERVEVSFGDLLDGLAALVQRCLGVGRAIVLALDDDGRLQPVWPADAEPDLVARALARSGRSLRSVGGDPPGPTTPDVAHTYGPALCIPVRSQDHQMIGILYAETGSADAEFPIDVVDRLKEALPLPAAAPLDPPPPDGADAALRAARRHTTSGARSTIRSLADLERDAILHALEACRGNRTVTARALGISVRKLQYRLKEYAEQGIVVGWPSATSGA